MERNTHENLGKLPNAVAIFASIDPLFNVLYLLVVGESITFIVKSHLPTTIRKLANSQRPDITKVKLPRPYDAGP